MLYTGPAFSATALGEGIVELKFDLAGESVNKLNAVALQDFAAATQAIAKDAAREGVVVTSGKGVFIVGADITEFGAMFAAGEEGIAKSVLAVHRMLSAFEDLPVPTVIAINGVCLGGGLELALAGDYRVMSTAASVGFPEVKLGIFPGFGGSVRMPRIIGIDNAVEWICSGADKKADAALKDGAVDAVVAPEQLRDAALAMLKQCIAGKLDWQGRRADQARAAQAQQDGTDDGVHVVDGRGGCAGRPELPGADAGAEEHAGSGHARPRRRARSRGEVFRQGRRDAAGQRADRRLPRRPGRQEGRQQLGEEEQARDQAGGRARRRHHGRRHRLPGGATRALPIVMKDIRDEALALGMNEAGKLLTKQVEKGRMTPAKMSETLGRIRPTLNYGDFGAVDIIIEAVVENPKVKKAVLAEVEGLVREDTIIASNTSTISISLLAAGPQAAAELRRHALLQPGHMMPLVEVIRGKQSSEDAVAATVKLATPHGQDADRRERLPGIPRQPRAVPVLRRASTCCCATAPTSRPSTRPWNVSAGRWARRT